MTITFDEEIKSFKKSKKFHNEKQISDIYNQIKNYIKYYKIEEKIKVKIIEKENDELKEKIKKTKYIF